MFKSADISGFIANVASNTQFYLEEPIVGIHPKKKVKRKISTVSAVLNTSPIKSRLKGS